MRSNDPRPVGVRREEHPIPRATWLILRQVRKVIAAVVGITVLAIGIAMLVLPGPAFVVIPLGLGILAAEFAWARHVLDQLKHHGRRALGPGWRKVLKALDRLRSSNR